MKPDLGLGYNTDWPGRPPHMGDADRAVWRKWQPANVARFETYYFDVGLGDGAPLADPEDAFAQHFARLTRKRADVVAETPTSWTLIEVKAQAQPGALGQLQTYATLWRLDPPDDRPLSLLLVTDLVDADTRRALAAAGVDVETV